MYRLTVSRKAEKVVAFRITLRMNCIKEYVHVQRFHGFYGETFISIQQILLCTEE